MIEVQVQQGSAEWLKMRLGKITGTRLCNVFKSDNLSLVDELIAEIETGELADNYVSKAMQEGSENEPLARQVYEMAMNVHIEPVGFCLSGWSEYLALSPDGFTPCRTGAVEIKCPTVKTHVKYIRQNQLPNEYKYQIYAYFLVNPKLQWVDFVSFNEKFQAKPMFRKRIMRDEIETELSEVKKELEKFTAKLEKYYKQVIN